ncbi:MAG: hypothetical protein JO061_10430 [Acidobacteriaceae bacterium]|nr:hypothetical protein [Acidobacteriaceae bacterium]
MRTITPPLPSFSAPVEEWITAGLVTRSETATDADLRGLTFDVAQAKRLVYLNGKGALALEREGLRHAPTGSGRL